MEKADIYRIEILPVLFFRTIGIYVANKTVSIKLISIIIKNIDKSIKLNTFEPDR